jgi:polyphenol oxidase
MTRILAMTNSTIFHKSFIVPDWPAPANVKAFQTTRQGGFSQGTYTSLNLGYLVKDKPLLVTQNRQMLSQYLPSEPVWINQVHGIDVIDADATSCVPQADASFAKRKHTVCVTMTADCLPVLLCDSAGTAVAAIHAGWRSLCGGVIEATIEAMGIDGGKLLAWLGPAIGPDAFEVGEEVRQQFIAQDAQAESAFKTYDDKWLGDLYTIARQRLGSKGVTQIYGGGLCTYTDQARFFSFRRDGDTGRMGTFIWLESTANGQ